MDREVFFLIVFGALIVGMWIGLWFLMRRVVFPRATRTRSDVDEPRR